MDRNKLKQLLKMEEGPKLDFKAKLSLATESEKRELAKDVTAIANSRGGRGYIVFGVEDKTKRICGIDSQDFEEERIQQIIYNRCDPPVSISVDFAALEDKTVAVITVYKSNNKPHQIIQNGAFYIRRGSTTDMARRSEIASLFQENGLMSYETVVLKGVGKDELDMNMIKKFFHNLNIESDKPDEVLLEALGIVGKLDENEDYSPTIGGMLLFGKNPSLFMPQVYIKVSYNEDVRFFYGNLLDMLDHTMEYMRGIIPGDFAFEAAEEAIANAIVHRDYLDHSRGIAVTVSSKNMEISNPGSLLAGNSIYKFMKEHNPDRRNPWLYQRLITLDDKKRFMKTGIGLTRIKKFFPKAGEVKFLNIGSQNLFKVILPRSGMRNGKGGDNR